MHLAGPVAGRARSELWRLMQLIEMLRHGAEQLEAAQGPALVRARLLELAKQQRELAEQLNALSQDAVVDRVDRPFDGEQP